MKEIGDAYYYENNIYLLGSNVLNRTEDGYKNLVRIKLQNDLD